MVGDTFVGGTSLLTATGSHGYLVKTDSSGSMQWQETLSGNGDCAAYDVQQTNDGGYIVVGSTYPGHAGLLDVYLAKL